MPARRRRRPRRSKGARRTANKQKAQVKNVSTDQAWRQLMNKSKRRHVVVHIRQVPLMHYIARSLRHNAWPAQSSGSPCAFFYCTWDSRGFCRTWDSAGMAHVADDSSGNADCVAVSVAWHTCDWCLRSSRTGPEATTQCRDMCQALETIGPVSTWPIGCTGILGTRVCMHVYADQSMWGRRYLC